jgi:hypothetical protein
VQDAVTALSDVVQRQFVVMTAAVRALQQKGRAKEAGPSAGEAEETVSGGDRLEARSDVPSAR